MDSQLKQIALGLAHSLNQAAIQIAALANPPTNRRFSDLAGELVIDGQTVEPVGEETIRGILDEARTEGVYNPPAAPSIENAFLVKTSLKDFTAILARALNTADPHKTPVWAIDIHDRLFDRKEPLTITFELTP